MGFGSVLPNVMKDFTEILYCYRAIVTRVIDGDTLVVDIDLGLGVWKKDERIRLLGLNTPELRDAGGVAAKEYVESKMLAQPVFIQTRKDKKGKYGRYLGVIYFYHGAQVINLNDLLVEKGYAEVRK